MSKFLQRLYKEVLDKFPFSISGYDYPDKEYEKFFHSICKFQESLEEDNKIRFTISGFAKLQTTSNLSETELDKWKTESLKYLLFNDNYLGFSEPILSLYISALEHISPGETQNGEFIPGKRVVNILAENVNNSILIKVLLNEKLEKIHFSFVKSDNTLLIEVPIFYFKSVKNDKVDSLLDLFKDIDYESDLIVKREGSSSSYSIVLTEARIKKFQSVLRELLDLKTIEAISKLPPENVYDKLLKEVLKNEKYSAKEIYSLIFASAVLCYFYDCSLTYFVSTARLANDKRYTLGAMGIGLKTGNELSDNNKALYSILVNHLAANLSTQLIFESNKYLQRENNKVNLREALNKVKILNAQVLHGEVKTESGFDESFTEIYNEHSQLLTEYFFISYIKLKDKNRSHISKYCLVELRNSGDCGNCNITERHKLFKSNSGEKCCSSIGNMELINLPFIEALFEKLTTSEKGNIVTLDSSHVTDDNEIVVCVNYSNGFDVKTFTEKLKESHNGSLIGEFFIKKFEVLDCHGVFKMIDIRSGKEFFNSREAIQGVNLNEKKVIINENYKFPNIQIANKIKIIFKNEL